MASRHSRKSSRLRRIMKISFPTRVEMFVIKEINNLVVNGKVSNIHFIKCKCISES